MTPRKIKSPLSWQSRVNQLLQLNKGCWAANRDVYLSIELRDGVKICLTFLASSVSWVSGSWGRRQRGPRRRNRQGNNTAAAPSNECDAPGGEPPKRSLGGFERNSYQGEPFLFVLAYQGKTSPQRSTRRASAPPGNLFDAQVSPGCGRDKPSPGHLWINPPAVVIWPGRNTNSRRKPQSPNFMEKLLTPTPMIPGLKIPDLL